MAGSSGTRSYVAAIASDAHTSFVHNGALLLPHCAVTLIAHTLLQAFPLLTSDCPIPAYRYGFIIKKLKQEEDGTSKWSPPYFFTISQAGMGLAFGEHAQKEPALVPSGLHKGAPACPGRAMASSGARSRSQTSTLCLVVPLVRGSIICDKDRRM